MELLKMVVLLNTIYSGLSQPLLKSRMDAGDVCPNSELTFECTAQGSVLIWLFNGASIYIFEDTAEKDVKRLSSTGHYSVLLSNDNGRRLSTLTFPNVSQNAGSFMVSCSDGSMTSTTMRTNILDIPVMPSITNSSDVGKDLLSVFWSSSSPQFVQYYELFLDGMQYSRVKEFNDLIKLSDCRRNSTLSITAIDQCGQASEMHTVPIPTQCETSTADPDFSATVNMQATTPQIATSTVTECAGNSNTSSGEVWGSLIGFTLGFCIFIIASIVIIILLYNRIIAWRLKVKKGKKTTPSSDDHAIERQTLKEVNESSKIFDEVIRGLQLLKLQQTTEVVAIEEIVKKLQATITKGDDRTLP